MPASEGANMEDLVSSYLAGMQAHIAAATAPDGPFPLAEEDVAHFGTTQRYRCWQKGPNSVVQHTLPELFGDSFCRFIDKEFLVYESDRLTFGAAMEAATALSRAILKNYDISKTACVAIAGRNYPEWVIALLTVNGHLRCMALPVNSWWMDDELRYGLEDSKTSLLIADFERLQRAPFLQEINVPVICMRAGKHALPSTALRFESLIEAGRLLPPVKFSLPAAQDDNAMLMYTSGTTNKPKGVVLTQRGIMCAVNTLRSLNYSLEPKPQDVILQASPLFHVNGSHVGLLAAIANGNKLILMYKWDATKALDLIQSEKINGIVGVPTNTYDLVNHPNFAKYDTSSMRGLGGGGAAFSAPMIKRVSEQFKNASAGTGYGLTETNAVTIIMPAPLFPARPTSCGFPCANVEVCILGDNNQKLPAGGVGEICIRGPNVMKEYWGKPDKTAEVFHVDDTGRLWFRSGDVGRLDEQQFVYIMDRAKDIIIRGGENISCAEVEGALFEHPSIAEVAAVGVPHETLGEAVAVAIVFKAGVSTPSMEQLKTFSAARLATFKTPSEFYVWEDGSLPRGATGKMQKRDIRERLSEIRKRKQEGAMSKL